jgi:hypothetical protein
MNLPRIYVPPSTLAVSALFVIASWVAIWMWGAKDRARLDTADKGLAMCVTSIADLEVHLADAERFRDQIEPWLGITPADTQAVEDR